MRYQTWRRFFGRPRMLAAPHLAHENPWRSAIPRCPGITHPIDSLTPWLPRGVALGMDREDRAARLKAEADQLDGRARRLREEAKSEYATSGPTAKRSWVAYWMRVSAEDRGWHVIHSVVISKGGSDIDHVVVGRPGFSPSTPRHHPEGRCGCLATCTALLVSPRPYFSAAISEGEKAARFASARLVRQRTGLPGHRRCR